MWALFQSSDKVLLSNDLFNRMDRGMQTGSAMSLIIWVGQPSGSGDLPDFKFVILLRTKTGVN